MPLLLGACLTWLTGLVPAPDSGTATTPPHAIQDQEPASVPDETLAALESLLAGAEAAREGGEHARARALVASAIEAALPLLERRAEPELGQYAEELGTFACEVGELRAAERIQRALVEHRRRTLPPDDLDLQRARLKLAVTIRTLGDLHEARAIERDVLAVLERVLPEDHADLLAARVDLGWTSTLLGDLAGARASFEEVLAISERDLPQDAALSQAARLGLAYTLVQLGDPWSARAIAERGVAIYERTLSPHHPNLRQAREILAAVMRQVGDYGAARTLHEAVLSACEQSLPSDHPDLHRARSNLASTLSTLGDSAAALALLEQVLSAREATLPGDHLELAVAMLNLAVACKGFGDVLRARGLEERALTICEQTLPEEHPVLQGARDNLAITLRKLGDHAGARALSEQVLALRERTLPEDHPSLQSTRLVLADTLTDFGELGRARELQERAVAARERTLAADHIDIQRARLGLAATMRASGELHGALALQEQVLGVLERTLPEDHVDVQVARNGLAVTLTDLGDLGGARLQLERVLEVHERTLPEDHSSLQTTRTNLAVTLKLLGDLAGARALEERVLAVLERTQPENHPDLLLTRHNLAVSLKTSGDLEGARVLEQDVLEILERTLPEEHTRLQTARLSLSATLAALGDFASARSLAERALDVLERTHPQEHPLVQLARGSLASGLARLGQIERARELEEQVLALRERTLPGDHPDLLHARRSLAVRLAELAAIGASGSEPAGEEWLRAKELCAQLVRGHLRAARVAICSGSAREAEERVGGESARALGLALSFASGYGCFEPSDALLDEAFELSETTRAVALASAGSSRGGVLDEERERLRAEMSMASVRLSELAVRGTTPEAYHRERGRREAAERGLLALTLAQDHPGSSLLEVGVESLGSVLGDGTALVSYRLFPRWWLTALEPDVLGGSSRFMERSHYSLGAFVLRRAAGAPRLAFVDLGAADRSEELAGTWRRAIRAASERGIGVETGVDPALDAGRRLREALWDPLLEHLTGAERVVVASDDVLHLVPLDALPLGEGDARVGDRWRIEQRLALWELLDAQPPAVGTTALVSLGGASFNGAPLDLEVSDRADLDASEEGAAPRGPDDAVAVLRGGAWERGFAPLAHSGREAHGLAALFDEAFEGAARAIVLDRRRASRAALVEAAPRARFLHVATHGWFAPESVRSWADAQVADAAGGLVQRLEAQETVRGMNPMLLCGLALAGANLPPDSLGRVPGLVTAEELATLDLTGCELVVLSACDTNVGQRRAGQGVASLQKALHLAGARSVITSLWKVPDEATAELMLDFYRRLWVEQKPKHQALWEAKLRLRRAVDETGRPLYTTRDWAAWVLTGDPD